MLSSARRNPDDLIKQMTHKRFTKSFGNFSGALREFNGTIDLNDTFNTTQNSIENNVTNINEYLRKNQIGSNNSLGSRGDTSSITSNGFRPGTQTNNRYGQKSDLNNQKLYGQFFDRIQNQQPVPTIMIGQVLKRISL